MCYREISLDTVVGNVTIYNILVYRGMHFDPSYVNVTLCVTLELST